MFCYVFSMFSYVFAMFSYKTVSITCTTHFCRHLGPKHSQVELLHIRHQPQELPPFFCIVNLVLRGSQNMDVHLTDWPKNGSIRPNSEK